MLNLKSTPSAVTAAFRCMFLGIVLMTVIALLGGCANMQTDADGAAIESGDFAAFETVTDDVVEKESGGIDLDVYGIDY